MTPAPYDVLAFGAHPDDLEAVMGGTAAKMAAKGRSILFVDLCDGEPARHAGPGERGKQAAKAASILGVDRCTLRLRDRLIRNTNDARLAVARLIRLHRPRLVFTTAGAGVHPDHQAVTDTLVHQDAGESDALDVEEVLREGTTVVHGRRTSNEP